MWDCQIKKTEGASGTLSRKVADMSGETEEIRTQQQLDNKECFLKNIKCADLEVIELFNLQF